MDFWLRVTHNGGNLESFTKEDNFFPYDIIDAAMSVGPRTMCFTVQ